MPPIVPLKRKADQDVYLYQLNAQLSAAEQLIDNNSSAVAGFASDAGHNDFNNNYLHANGNESIGTGKVDASNSCNTAIAASASSLDAIAGQCASYGNGLEGQSEDAVYESTCEEMRHQTENFYGTDEKIHRFSEMSASGPCVGTKASVDEELLQSQEDALFLLPAEFQANSALKYPPSNLGLPSNSHVLPRGTHGWLHSRKTNLLPLVNPPSGHHVATTNRDAVVKPLVKVQPACGHMSTEQLKDVFLLRQKFTDDMPSTMLTSSRHPHEDQVTNVHHLPMSELNPEELRKKELAILRLKRLKLSASNALKVSGTVCQPTTKDNRKRSRGVARLDRLQVLKCLSCDAIQFEGYTYGDYVECRRCGINNFVVIREWSPSVYEA